MGQSSKNTLKLVSFNCKSLKRSVDSVRGLCDTSDVVALQETWLLPHDLAYLNSVHNDFEATGSTAVDTSTGILVGRPKGGVAILYRKGVFTSVSVVKCSSVRLCAVKCQMGGDTMLFFSVYMPVDCSDNLAEFTECLSEINAIIEDCGISIAFILGDFNAHPGERFFKEMQFFCEEQEWLCADYKFLSDNEDVYTYVSDCHGCSRWLDHCLVTNVASTYIENINIINSVSWSDHYPMEIYCRLGKLQSQGRTSSPTNINRVYWGCRDDVQSNRYTEMCNKRLKLIDFPSELADCNDNLCKIPEHTKVINRLYSEIISTLQESAIDSHKSTRRHAKRCITGWNKHVRAAHVNARLCFQAWVLAGKPTCGATYDDMRSSRKLFKNKLKWCQDNEEQLKMDILATSYEAKHFGKFWQYTNRLNAQAKLPAAVDGLCDSQKIANMFKVHFEIEPSDIGCDMKVGAKGIVTKDERPVQFTLREVNDAIKHMKRGKSPGHDGLSVEHLRYGGVHLPRVLKMFFNLCIVHSYLPDALMMTLVVPIIKNRIGDAADKSNYRPISLATITAKVLDSLLDAQLSRAVEINDAQFGFRPGLSTESAILCLKQTVWYYTERKTPVYACFLDLSKAFDLVSYRILWQKLSNETTLKPELVSLFQYWYGNQINMVKWGETLSKSYKLQCGVRQGGLSSPRLFNLYVNKLIERLSAAGIGCSIDGMTINNISYADDMVLLSPSVAGLRKLLKICEDYARENGLRYNPNKSEFLVFRGKNKPSQFKPIIQLCGNPLKQVTEFKYLGHIVIDSLEDDKDIDRERRALSVRGNMLARRFARCTTQIKLTLFRAYCQSFYTCSLWTGFKRRTYSALRVQYNNVLRAVLKMPRHCSASGMFADARVDDFYAIIRKRAASMMKRLLSSSNMLLRIWADKLDSPLWRSWNAAHILHRGNKDRLGIG